MRANSDKFQIQTWFNGRYLVSYESHSLEQAKRMYAKPYYRRMTRRLVRVVHQVEILQKDSEKAAAPRPRKPYDESILLEPKCR